MRSPRIALVTASLVLAAGATACRSSHIAADAGRLQVTGKGELARGGGAFRAVSGTSTVHAGDRIRLTAGTARLDLGRGGRIELRPGAELQFADPLVLQSGDLLVQPQTAPLAVTTDDADVQVASGAAQVSRTLALTVTAYRGASTVSSPGASSLTVMAPRQATVPARGVVPAQAAPAHCSDPDPWAQRFLAAPCDVGTQLGSIGSGMSAQLPAGEGHTPGFFRLLVPTLEQVPEVDTALNLDRDPGDNLLASVIAAHAREGTFTSRVEGIYSFRDQGQDNWGLVALDQGVTDVAPLNTDMESALGRAPKRFASAFALSGPGGPPGAAGSGVRTGGASSVVNGGQPTTSPGASGSPGTPGTPGSPGSTPTTPPGGGPAPTTPPTTLPTSPPTTLPTPPTTGPLPVPLPTVPTTPTTSPGTTPTTTPVDPIIDPLLSTVTTTITTIAGLVGGLVHH